MWGSQRKERKRNRMCALCIVSIVSCGIGILIWQIENIIVLLVVDYADICLLRHLYKAIYKNIENEIFRYKKIQAICKFLIEHIAIWTLILGLVFSSIITVSATGKSSR